MRIVFHEHQLFCLFCTVSPFMETKEIFKSLNNFFRTSQRNGSAKKTSGYGWQTGKAFDVLLPKAQGLQWFIIGKFFAYVNAEFVVDIDILSVWYSRGKNGTEARGFWGLGWWLTCWRVVETSFVRAWTTMIKSLYSNLQNSNKRTNVPFFARRFFNSSRTFVSTPNFSFPALATQSILNRGSKTAPVENKNDYVTFI